MKITKLWLTTIVVILCSLAAKAHDFEMGGIYYNITSETDLTVEVTFKGPRHDDYKNEYSGAIAIPSTVSYNGKTYRVTSIGYAAIQDCNSLTAITIPESVTSIEGYAFSGCSSLTAITIPESVVSISGGAFSYCSSVSSIIVAAGNARYDSRNGCNAIIDKYGNNLIQGCSTTIIPENVTCIGYSAFEGCSALAGITIPKSVTSIQDGAFNGCSNLTTLTLPDGVTSIGPGAFMKCDKLTSINIPASVSSIGNRAFYGCSSLTSITIPKDVTNIEDFTFDDCSSLATVTLPENLKNIGYGAFYGCSSLTTITLPKSLMDIDGYAFFDCRSLTTIIIPENVERVRHDAFRGCSSLTSITLPKGLIDIGGNAFYECSSLTAIDIPDGVTSIGESAFGGCNKLTSAVIPESSKLTSIGERAFSDCNSLETITIPEGVTSIGESAFSDCSNLVYINLPNGLTTIEGLLFSRCSGLKSITIPKNVTTILGGAFGGCSSLTTIAIPKNSELTSIGFDAFFGCTSLESIVIPEGVTSIGESAFSDCSNLVSITFSENSKLTSIGYNAFSDCASLESIVIPDGVTTIGDNTFYMCSKLTSINIPESVTSIGKTAFYNCSSLTSITLPNSVAQIGKAAFSNCANINSINIPKGLNTIESSVFAFCENLTSITIPESVTSVGNGAFYFCKNLKDVYCNAESVPTTDEMAFASSGYMSATLYVPTSAIGSYKSTSPWSNFSTIVSLNEKVASITLSQTTATLTEKEELTLIAIVAPDYATDLSVVWNSNNPDVARVDDNGVITAIAPGIATITVTANDGSGVSASCEITVLGHYKITYILDGEIYRTDILLQGTGITLPEEPFKEGYTFSGWSEMPETMPAHDVTVYGTFTKLVVEAIVINDSDFSFSLEENTECGEITYTRTFRNTNWQALYVPFEILVTEEFLADFEVADINDVRQYDRDNDGKKDDTVIEAFKQTKGVLAANYPYLIRAKEAGEKTITVTDATLYAAEENSIDCSSVREKFTFTGTYNRLSSDELPQGQGYYALSGGVWQPVAANASLGAFRFYLKVESRDGLNSNNKAIRMRIIGEDGTSEISELELSGNSQQSTVMYDLQGRRINDTSNLKGLYIVNGKKVMF